MKQELKTRVCKDPRSSLSGAGGQLRLLELCAGVGVIGLSLAHAAVTWKGTDKVHLLSTDWNPHGKQPFKLNADHIFANAMDSESRRGFSPQVLFQPWSIDEALSKISGVHALGGAADVLILDPPWRGLAQHHREGCGFVRGEIAARNIRNCPELQYVIYMSCGYESFMEDADRLTGADRAANGKSWGPPFRLVQLTCYDMFPFTSHIETVGIFERLPSGTQIPPQSNK